MKFLRSIFGRPYLFALFLAIVGVTLLIGGVRLLLLGGSAYYVLAGAATLASGVFVAMGRRIGALLFGALLLVTTAWAVGEVGFAGWSLLARLAGPAAVGLWFVLPWTARRLHPQHTRPLHTRLATALAGLALAVGLGAAIHTTFVGERPDPMYQAGVTAVPAPVTRAPADTAGDDWPVWGGDSAGTRFSTAGQITPANADKLELAWTYHFGAAPPGAPASLEVTPLKIGDTLYACNDYNDVVALDAETGRQVWRFHARTNTQGATYGHCRGVAYYRVPGASGRCAERIYTNTVDARILAIDKATGRLCQGFGRNGEVDLKVGMPMAPTGYYYVTSAPTIARGRIVLGGWVVDGMYWGEPSGVIRAFDAVDGTLSWAFDVGRPDRTGAPPAGETYTPSTPNAWAPMSADDSLGLVYVPLGGAVPDYAGAQRRPFDNAWSSSVVALDVETGRARWRFQTTHHDLWDYDVPSQPTLVDLETPQGPRRALVQPTKRGEVFVLDRATGKPIRPVTEVAVPQGGMAPGERASATQPFSNAMPSFRGVDIAERDMWGITPLDQLWCRIKFREARYEGPLTPPGFSPSIAYPGFLGGMNWGGVSIDRARGLMIVNSNYVGNYAQLVKREEADRLGVRPVGMGSVAKPEGQTIQPQMGTPFAVRSLPFLSPLFAPCQAPPWGRLSAVDLASGKLVWSHPLGTARDSGPLGLPSMLPFRIGTPNLGGSVTTRGGVIFIAATQDKYLRAIDVRTGKVLWRGRLPQAGQATPMTYISRASGRQFVVTASGGHAFLGTRPGDAIYAFALPQKR
ncbi:membrane-bound PQQ-dependent dehydrogenase, glucose/quinate/shikimate family [Novosphingobium sp. BL-52-GroH]|uniref:membrane-bound PQQ-dependent dehydrogenase, glucose/quinate/shikimate family n=1 Tax=Novosphingobium sp. BL-52-GroH TaxID=3349877 RepID=UPI00384C9A67